MMRIVLSIVFLAGMSSPVWAGQIVNSFTGDLDRCVTFEDDDTVNRRCAPVTTSAGRLADDGDGTYSLTVGNVAGPASSTDNALARWDGTGGTTLQDSAVTVADTSGNMVFPDNAIIGLSATTGRLEFDDQATDEVNILDANVGIGTASPGTNLEISSSVADGPILRISNAGTEQTTGEKLGSLEFYSADNSSALSGVKAFIAPVENDAGAGRDFDLTFATGNTVLGGSVAEKMRLDKNGFLGLGDTSPNYPLIVQNAGTLVTGTLYGIGSFVKDGTLTGITYGYSANQIAAIIADTNSAASQMGFWTYSGSAYLERMRIDSAGNVGIGTTSPQGKLDITTAATNDDVNYWFQQARAATTDATVTTLDTFAITASRTYVLDTRVVARRTGGTAGTADDGAAYIRRALVTTKAGTVTINAVQDGLTQEDQAGWDCTLTVSGTNILLRITGAADNSVTWHSTSTVSWVGT